MAISLLCASSCGAASSDVPANYHDPCAFEVRKYGARQLVWIRCDYVFTDITDDAEWTAAVAADQIGVSPHGIVTLNEPSQNTFQIDGCGTEYVEEAEYDIDFQTYFVDSALLDFDYWKTVFSGFTGYRLMWFDCNGILFLTDNFANEIKTGTPPIAVAGESPGFEFSVTKTPVPIEGEGNLWQWSTQFRIKSINVLCGVYLPDIITALTA